MQTTSNTAPSISQPPTPTPTPSRTVSEPSKISLPPIGKNPFDETEELALYFDSTVNGDIYDKKTNELICTSGKQHIVVRGIGNIHEKVMETYPCFDGTLIRAFHFNDQWHLATRKKM